MNDVDTTNHYSNQRSRTAFFRRSKEPLGGLGNMAGGFPLTFNGLYYNSSEALYQCARFIDKPTIVNAVRDAQNGFASKLVAKQYYEESRPDWMEVRVVVMSQVLIVKSQQHYKAILRLMEETNGLPIVEYSKKDPFWGAQPVGDELIGRNVLGKLWQMYRNDILDGSIRCYDVDRTLFPSGDDQLVDIFQL
jgi:ribA/ribD-fused uncharacterized protein